MSDFINFLNEKNKSIFSKEQKVAERQELHKSVITSFYTKVKLWLSEAEQQGLLVTEERDSFNGLKELLLDFKMEKIKVSPEPVDYINNSMVRIRLNGYQTNSDKAVFFALKEGVWFLEEKTSLFPKLTSELTKDVFENIIKGYL